MYDALIRPIETQTRDPITGLRRGDKQPERNGAAKADKAGPGTSWTQMTGDRSKYLTEQGHKGPEAELGVLVNAGHYRTRNKGGNGKRGRGRTGSNGACSICGQDGHVAR